MNTILKYKTEDTLITVKMNRIPDLDTWTLLNQDFFARDTLQVARDLLGKVILHKSSKGDIAVIINETEAYTQDDSASHAFKGQTSRNAALFEDGGCVYTYLSYGIHTCMNFVTEFKGRGSGVLIRGALPYKNSHLLLNTSNHKRNLLNGPGKLTKSLAIPLAYSGLQLYSQDSPISLYDIGISPASFIQTPRVGISKAKDLPWRFYATDFI